MLQDSRPHLSEETLRKLESYKSEWELSELIFICRTNMCEVFRTTHQGRPAVLKLLNETGKKFESLAPRVLTWLNGHGAVQVFNHDDGAHLLEFADGEMLDALVKRGGDIEATRIVCETLKKIHSQKNAFPNGLHSMERNFQSLFLRCAKPDCEALFLRGEQMARHLLKTEREIRVLHGDLHHENLLHDSKRGWLAIDPQCLIGEKTYDVANTYFNPKCLGEERLNPQRIQSLTEIFSRELQIPKKRILEFVFAYGCLSSVWMIDDGFDPTMEIRLTEAVESHLRELNQND